MAVLALAIAILFAPSSVALASDRWLDISDQMWIDTYGITAEQAAGVASGYADGMFRPYQAVTRAQFAKMVVTGLGLAVVTPALPSFSDVPPSDSFYGYVEGAKAAGIVNGVSPNLFDPQATITRQQANSMLARFLSERELAAMNMIWGTVGSYYTLSDWSNAESPYVINFFEDVGQLDSKHRPGTAYLVFHDVVNGSHQGGYDFLEPLSSLSRAQSVTMVLRTYDAISEVAPDAPPAPVSLRSYPASPSREGTPSISGKTVPGGTVTVFDTYEGSSELIWLGQVNADQLTGWFSLQVPAETPLAEGRHQITARVRSRHPFPSPYSLPLTYIVDTQGPEVSIACPVGGSYLDSGSPLFAASASDPVSGVARVEFLYAVDSGNPVFHSISVDSSAPYQADWGGLTLQDGRYVFSCRATDEAGNEAQSEWVHVCIDTAAPLVTVVAPTSGSQVVSSVPYLIVWQATDVALPPACITVSLSVDAGVSWTEIAGRIDNAGYVAWTPPVVPGPISGCQIRVEAVDLFGRIGAANSQPFTIVPEVAE